MASRDARPLVHFLTLYFLSLSLLPFLSVSRAVSDNTYQVVFEEVGQVATSVSYLHVAIDLHIPDIQKYAKDYQTIIETTFNAAGPSRAGTGKVAAWDEVMDVFASDFRTLKNQFTTRYNFLLSRLNHLTEIMPHTAESAVHEYVVEDVRFRRHTRTKRALPLVILKGVVGTLMGLYNRRQTSKLRDSLESTIKQQRRLMATVATHDAHITKLQTEYSYLPLMVKQTSLMGPMKVLVRLLEIEAMIEKEISRATSAIQEAQHRRLSITILSGSKLLAAFERIKNRAQELRLELLIERPSDLFQIEVSYFFDGHDVSLLLHVPMAAPNSLLRLHRFLPFPLSFTESHFLLPRPDKNLFAISSGEPRLSLELNEADLEGCYRINSLHLCERLGVLSARTDRSCLGALYNQDFERATSLCHMDVVDSAEQVLQLENNRYLVYATHSFTAPLSCRNMTANELHFKTGVNRIQISPSCSLSLQDHVIFSDSALLMGNQIKKISWNPEELEMMPEEMVEAAASIDDAAADGHDTPSLTNLRQRSGHRRRWIGWVFFFLLLGLVIAVAISLGVPVAVYMRKLVLLKQGVKLIRTQVSNAISRAAQDRLSAITRAAQDRLGHRSSHSTSQPQASTSSASRRPAAAAVEAAAARLPIESEYTEATSDYVVAVPRSSNAPPAAEARRSAGRRHRPRVGGRLLSRGRLIGQRELSRLLARIRPESRNDAVNE